MVDTMVKTIAPHGRRESISRECQARWGQRVAYKSDSDWKGLDEPAILCP
jgi:hypothetical protein